MAHKDIYPYKNRLLQRETTKTPREQNTDPSVWAWLAIVNLKEGDAFSIQGESLVVSKAEDELIEILQNENLRISITPESLIEHPLCIALAEHLVSLCPDYVDPLCAIIERDPTVYRLRSKKGWVVSDVLCLMSGNVQYSPSEIVSPEKVAASPPPNEHPQRNDAGSPQIGFDF
jgi:hypothetical protein